MIIYVKVNPSSAKQEVIQLGINKYKVYLKSPPSDNKANIELVKLLHKYFKKEVAIKSGFTSKNKIIETK
ncbi:MAG: DUF167 domain-containing protein [Candidatus Nanoarchaeia archaeon]